VVTRYVHIVTFTLATKMYTNDKRHRLTENPDCVVGGEYHEAEPTVDIPVSLGSYYLLYNYLNMIYILPSIHGEEHSQPKVRLGIHDGCRKNISITDRSFNPEERVLADPQW
jgi:hypothetical protein